MKSDDLNQYLYRNKLYLNNKYTIDCWLDNGIGNSMTNVKLKIENFIEFIKFDIPWANDLWFKYNDNVYCYPCDMELFLKNKCLKISELRDIKLNQLFSFV